MRKHACFLILSLWIILSTVLIPSTVGEDGPKGNISFEPNIIPETNVTFVDSRFVFEWLNNRFEIAMYLEVNNTEFELEIEEDKKTKIKIKHENGTDSECEAEWKCVIDRSNQNVTWGLMFNNISRLLADYTESFKFNITNANFNLSEIELLELGENDTKICLPDNLFLSYEDLWLYDFMVSHPNKHETIVKGLKGNTTWNLDPITYSDPTITVTGEYNSEANWHVWNASNVNGWGAVFNYDNMTYFYNSSKLVIDTGATFKDKNVQMVFNTTNEIAIYNNRGTFQLGNLEDATNKVTSGGCHVLFDLSGGAQDLVYYGVADSVTKFYGCILESQNHQSLIYIYHDSANAYFYDTTLSGLMLKAYLSNIDIKRLTQTTQSLGSGVALESISVGNFDDILIQGNEYAIIGKIGTITNLVARNNTYTLYCWTESQPTVYLVNPDVDVWNMRLIGTYTNEVYRQYTFDLTVTYPNGTGIQNANVTVKHYGQSEAQDFTELTDSNGQITTKTLSMGFYNQTGGNTIYSYNPYYIEVTNVTDYQDYSGNFTLGEKTEWNICLCPESYNWFGVTIIIGLLACFMFAIALTEKK